MKAGMVLAAIGLSLLSLCEWIAAGAQAPARPPQLLRARDYLTSSLGTLGMAVDAEGNVYVPSPALHVIYKVSPQGEVTVVAGTGTAGFSGNGGPATQAQLDAPTAVSLDTKGNLYVADRNSGMLRRISTGGIIQDVAIGPVATLAFDTADVLFVGLTPGASLSSSMSLLPVAAESSIGRAPQFARTPFGILASSESLLSMAFDAANNMYVADPDNSRVLQISPDAIMRVFAGTGRDGDGSDGGFAYRTPLFRPNAVAVDKAGNVYIAEAMRSRVRKVTVAGTIHTVDGPGVTFATSDDNVEGAAPVLGFPRALAVDAAGNLYVADTDNRGLRKVSPDGRVRILAEDVSLIPSIPSFSARQPSAGVPLPAPDLPVILSNTDEPAQTSPGLLPNGFRMLRGLTPSAEDLGLSTALLLGLPVTEQFSTTRVHVVFKTPSPAPAGYVAPRRVGIEPIDIPAPVRARGLQGHIEIEFVVDETGRVISPSLTWGMDCEFDDAAIQAIQRSRFEPARINGKPQKTAASAIVEFRIGRAAIPPVPVSQDPTGPVGIAVDDDGTLYFSAPGQSRIYTAAPGGGANPLAGRGSPGLSGNGFSANDAELRFPLGIASDAQGNVFIADTGNFQIRAVRNGLMIGVAGRGTFGFSGDRGRALCAQLNRPSGVAVDREGAIYIADTGNARIRKAVPNGDIRTIAGNGVPGFRGDGKSAMSAQLNRPTGVAIDPAGNVYVADSGNHRVRQVRKDGTIHTIAGTGKSGFGGDGAAGAAARLNDPQSIAVDLAGNVYIADTGNHRIRKWSAADGTINTIAGTGEPGARGDHGPAVTAQLRSPAGVAVDNAGIVYIADTGNRLIRRIGADGVMTTVVSRIP